MEESLNIVLVDKTTGKKVKISKYLVETSFKDGDVLEEKEDRKTIIVSDKRLKELEVEEISDISKRFNINKSVVALWSTNGYTYIFKGIFNSIDDITEKLEKYELKSNHNIYTERLQDEFHISIFEIKDNKERVVKRYNAKIVTFGKLIS